MGCEIKMNSRIVVRNILVDLDISDEQIVDDARLRGDLGLDSSELIEVSLELMRLLDVEVKIELENDPTVGDVCSVIDCALAGD